MKKLIYSLVVLMTVNCLEAQQIPVSNLYYFNPTSYNPALAGTSEKVNAFLTTRQWLTSIPGRPVTNMLNVEGPLASQSMGWGATVYSDRLGISNQLGLMGTYAYHVKLNDDHQLYFGLSAGVLQNDINRDDIVAKDVQDPLIANQLFRKATFDGNFGIAYRWEGLEVGVGINNLLASNVKYQTENTSISYTLRRHYFASIRYDFYTSDTEEIRITPMLFIRNTNNVPMPQDGGIMATYKDMFSVGALYRSQYGFSISAGIKLFETLQIGYSYDVITANIGAYAGGSHEVLLGYSFGILSKQIRKQQNQIDDMIMNLENFKEVQTFKDEIQTEILKAQQEGLDTLSAQYKENKNKIKEVERKANANEKELDALKKELMEAGLIKESSVNDYEGDVVKGYYLVIAAVKNTNYNADAMKKEFLSEGYKKVYNKKTGWHYVYTQRVDDFSKSLELLKEARTESFKDAWVHILK